MFLFPGVAAPQTMAEIPVAQAEVQEPLAAERLALEQEALADKYRHLEEVLLRMSELSAAADPRRAALLKKAVGQSKEKLIDQQFDSLVELLRKEQLSRAVENQSQVGEDLRALLELLLSENRAKRIESEKARIREYLKQLNEIINRQKDLQGRTAGSDQPKQLSGEQGELAQSAGDLADQIKRNEEANQGEEDKGKDGQKPADKGAEPGKGEPGEKTLPEGKSAEPKQGGGERQSRDKEQEKGQPSPSKQGKGGKDQGEKGDQGQAEQQSEQQPPQEDQHPARQRLEAARQRMREARQKLDQAERQGAVQEQEEAIRELEQAKADLEKILRQLREEEIGQVLTMLEARFQKMFHLQREVYEGTQRLDKASQDGMTREQEIESSRLSSQEADIALEAEKALTLLREEGSAVAMPEAVTQIRDDVQQVVIRLSRAKVDKITQSIEEDILSALQEMITALQKAIKDAEQRRQQARQNQPQGEPQDPKLVDVLAELKMIRAMQMRVNSRTERYSKLIQGEQAEDADMLEALDRLAEQQSRIHRITRDLEMGRNR